jgi:hypothetical protein
VGREPGVERVELARPARHGGGREHAGPAGQRSPAGPAREVQL